MAAIKVTVCVPVYGVEKYIGKCVRSLMEQTYPEIEYLFVDDCTKDRSMEVLEQTLQDYPDRRSAVRTVRHDHNRGLAAARKTAVEQATGEYVIHVDSDDYLSADAVSQLVQKAEETGADIVVGDLNFVSADHTYCHHDRVPSDKDEYARSLLIRKSFQGIAGKLIRRSLVIDHQLFTPEGLNMAEDYAVLPRIAYYANRVAKVDVPIYHYVKYNQDSYTAVINRHGIDCTVEALSILETFFRKVDNADFYADAIKLAKLYNKVTLLALADQSDYKYIRSLYPEVSIWRSGIELKHKLLLTAVACHADRLASSAIRRARKNM